MPSIPVIISRANPTVKWLASLSDKKNRDEAGCFLAEGEKLFAEALASTVTVSHILLRQDRDDLLFKANEYVASHPETKAIFLSHECFEKVSTEKAPQGVTVVIKYLDFSKYYNIIKKNIFTEERTGGVIFLDSIQDPGNIGAILRSASAFGITDVVLSADCADLYHPRTVRASMGALFRLRTYITNSLAQAVFAFRETGRRVYAASLRKDALPLSQVPLSHHDAVIIGNEGHGISSSVIDAADGSLYIPMNARTESLNASVAASILIWELMKN